MAYNTYGYERADKHPVNKQRILFLGLGSHYGGVEAYIEGLNNILVPYVEAYAVCSIPRLASALRAKGATVICLPLLGSKWFKALRLLLACLIVPYMLVRYRIETVQVNGFFEVLLLWPLQLFDCRTVYTMHGPFETELYSWFRSPARFFPRFFSKHSVRLATQVVCVSETIGDIARTVLPQDKVRVIANWVSTPSPFRQDFSIRQKPQILFVGRLEEYKGIQFILDAMRQIRDSSLLVVGGGTYRAQLEARAGGLDVRFAGFQPDPSYFYRESTVFVNPSLGPEGLPLVSLEAMAYGLPCIFSDLPVHREISAGGQAAALFKHGDSESLAQQLKLLLSDEVLRRRYGLAARQQIERNYSCPVAAEQYIRTFGLSQDHGAVLSRIATSNP